MTIIHSFFKLNNQEKLIFVKALYFLWIIRILLSLLPFSIIQKIIRKSLIIPPGNKSRFPLKKLIKAINIMSKYTPKHNMFDLCFSRSNFIN